MAEHNFLHPHWLLKSVQDVSTYKCQWILFIKSGLSAWPFTSVRKRERSRVQGFFPVRGCAVGWGRRFDLQTFSGAWWLRSFPRGQRHLLWSSLASTVTQITSAHALFQQMNLPEANPVRSTQFSENQLCFSLPPLTAAAPSTSTIQAEKSFVHFFVQKSHCSTHNGQ